MTLCLLLFFVVNVKNANPAKRFYIVCGGLHFMFCFFYLLLILVYAFEMEM